MLASAIVTNFTHMQDNFNRVVVPVEHRSLFPTGHIVSAILELILDSNDYSFDLEDSDASEIRETLFYAYFCCDCCANNNKKWLTREQLMRLGVDGEILDRIKSLAEKDRKQR